MTPKEYWETDGTRFLSNDNKPPTVQERVEEAFRAGIQEGQEKLRMRQIGELALLALEATGVLKKQQQELRNLLGREAV